MPDLSGLTAPYYICRADGSAWSGPWCSPEMLEAGLAAAKRESGRSSFAVCGSREEFRSETITKLPDGREEIFTHDPPLRYVVAARNNLVPA